MRTLRRLIRKLGHQRWFAEVNRRILPPVDRLLHRITGRKKVLTSIIAPTLVLHVEGRRTGKQRDVPLLYVREGDGFALAATNWGQDDHPLWSENLLANPDAAVTVQGRTIPVTARLADGSERREIWPRFESIWPAYRTYRERITGRDVRVFVLERRPG